VENDKGKKIDIEYFAVTMIFQNKWPSLFKKIVFNDNHCQELSRINPDNIIDYKEPERNQDPMIRINSPAIFREMNSLYKNDNELISFLKNPHVINWLKNDDKRQKAIHIFTSQTPEITEIIMAMAKSIKIYQFPKTEELLKNVRNSIQEILDSRTLLHNIGDETHKVNMRTFNPPIISHDQNSVHIILINTREDFEFIIKFFQNSGKLSIIPMLSQMAYIVYDENLKMDFEDIFTDNKENIIKSGVQYISSDEKLMFMQSIGKHIV
jgi:hypothetical protein